MKSLTLFYLSILFVGFALVIIDWDQGHLPKEHIDFFFQNTDLVGGILLIFYSAFNLGIAAGRNRKI